MGTTIVSLAAGPTGVFFGHVGDSRGYRIRNETIEQITEDHSLLNDYLKVHKLSAEDIQHFPHKNVIVRALGMKDTVAVDVNRLQVQPGDLYLLCSDGLSGMLTDAQILATWQACGGDLEEACKKLIGEANNNGGTDNITVVLVAFD